MKCFNPPPFRFCASKNATEGSLLRTVASASCHHHRLGLEGAPGPAWTKHIVYTRSEGVSRAVSPVESTQKSISSWFSHPSFLLFFFLYFPRALYAGFLARTPRGPGRACGPDTAVRAHTKRALYLVFLVSSAAGM